MLDASFNDAVTCELFSEETIEDNVSADSGVSLTPSSSETPSQAEQTLAEQQQSLQPPPPSSSSSQQQQQPNNLETAQADASKKAGIILDRCG